jgi:hypothetical protein
MWPVDYEPELLRFSAIGMRTGRSSEICSAFVPKTAGDGGWEAASRIGVVEAAEILARFEKVRRFGRGVKEVRS